MSAAVVAAGATKASTVLSAVGETSDNWKVYLLFIIAGFLVGGTWAAWQARSVFLTIITAVAALCAVGTASYWLIGEMT